MNTRADLSATIRRVSSHGTARKPGVVLAARMDHAQASEMAEQLRRDGVECVVNRA